MAKKELKEQLKSYEGYINDIPLVIDPCKQCKNVERKNEEQVEKCRVCCWYYTSSFEIKIKKDKKEKSKNFYYSRKGENDWHYSSLGKVDPEHYDYISAKQYHERYGVEE